MIGPVGMQVSGIPMNTATLRKHLPPPPGKKKVDVLQKLFGPEAAAPQKEPLPSEVTPYLTAMMAAERLTPGQAAAQLLAIPDFNALHAVRALALLVADHWQTILDVIAEQAITPWLEELAKDGGWADLDEEFDAAQAQQHVSWHYARQLIRSMSTPP